MIYIYKFIRLAGKSILLYSCECKIKREVRSRQCIEKTHGDGSKWYILRLRILCEGEGEAWIVVTPVKVMFQKESREPYLPYSRTINIFARGDSSVDSESSYRRVLKYRNGNICCYSEKKKLISKLDWFYWKFCVSVCAKKKSKDNYNF